MDYDQEVASIQTSICEYYQQNKTGLSNDELVYFGTMTEVAMFSAELWQSSYFGGQGKHSEFQNVLNNLCGESVQIRSICWSCIILADATGAVSAAATSLVASGGASAIPNPLFGGIPTAGVIAVIGGAGMSIGKAL